MYINGDMPPGLESIAADIQKLKVRYLRDGDQLTRRDQPPQNIIIIVKNNNKYELLVINIFLFYR